MERRSICFPEPGTQNVLHNGDSKFGHELGRLFASSENNALEALVALKARLRGVSTENFWQEVTEGMSSILGAEMTLVIKRVLVDDQNAAVEMPPIGEPGSCIMAAAFHWCARDGTKTTMKESRFHAWGCPCAYMRHDKVFVIPEDLPKFITNNPNKLPTPADAYIAVPLFAEGKCFAHFGAMWSKEAMMRRDLSWGFIEMLLHSLEDMILERFLEGANFVKPAAMPRTRSRIIPHDAVTLAQSLRPYAPSLSHELRTPMQGVVGMLDVMYATVQEAVESQIDPYLRKVFQSLKENIEVVQDSSRRAVEAADNFVHAADMDLTVPEPAPMLPNDESMDSPSSMTAAEKRPDILVAGSNLPLPRPNKRRREDNTSRNGSNASASKAPRVDGAASVWARTVEPSIEVAEGLHEAENVLSGHFADGSSVDVPTMNDGIPWINGGVDNHSRLIAPGLRHTNMREIFQYVINEGLKMGGRPDSAIAQETENGETIEVRSRGSDGTISSKTIEWSVDPGLPQTMFIDEKDLTKLISCVFLNAIKFTDQEHGYVRCAAKMSGRGRYISVKVADNGPGISAAFLPKLFKPFSQGDGTTTRPSEGLGLGLLVAKGIARKLGGDLMCNRAETEGPSHGSEFEIKVPVMAGETVTRPSSPFSSPRPRTAHMSHADARVAPPPTAPPTQEAPASPQHLSRALQDIVAGAHMTRRSSPRPLPTPTTSDEHQPKVNAKDLHYHSGSSPSTSPPTTVVRPILRHSVSNPIIDCQLAQKYPLRFLVAEDNKINRRLLVNMLQKLGYKNTLEAHDGAEAVRQMKINLARTDDKAKQPRIDVVLMDLWMPLMDGYEATQKIFALHDEVCGCAQRPTVLAVTADATDGAIERAGSVGMKGLMTKPYKMHDLQRLITEYCASQAVQQGGGQAGL
ncbi:hypothetical protein LTR78_002460 [Recurvomyces mirabilis]|uniref:histidine kinase n=1 Tax=Recurvomyces mirabilis TaxID=574656 RepID=A0AAE1C487_9PEZI|nr:hypothetical protein LTR78_002460 [Recurvomyces mirabilis]KAK5157389.1 hypothetical protein LTS14_004154 [Recurvomyces mirabilis]